MPTLKQATPEWYEKQYEGLTFDPGTEHKIASAAQVVMNGRARYEAMSKLTGVPWRVIGAMHNMECNCDFRGYLGNGERIIGTGRKSTLVPKGRGPFSTWEEGALDALAKYKDKVWRLGEELKFAESFNGLGYLEFHAQENSPYIWACTSVNDGFGKYVADGKYDPNAPTNAQVGVAAIYKQIDIWLGLPGPTAPPVPPPHHDLVEMARSFKLETPALELKNYAAQNMPGSHIRYWAIIDFNMNSKLKRFFLFDLQTGAVETHLAAHGAGSDPAHTGFPTLFSNVDGSHKTCLGIAKAGEIYTGQHGATLRLDGLEKSNSAMRSRAIVMHSADYVNEAEGRCGNSWGCPAVDPKYKDGIIAKLKGGSLINFYHG